MDDRTDDVRFRPMRPDDVTEAERLSAASFLEGDRRERRHGDPEPETRSPGRAADWITRTTHLLSTDPGGSWVAEDADGLLGVATSYNREKLWCLATYAVRPGLQGRGIGTALLAPALHHGRGSLRGMIASSADPRAVRRYRLAGFTLHPQMTLSGRLDRSAIPVDDVARVRAGTSGDVDLMDSVDRATRGAAHGPDHPLMLSLWPLLVCDTSTGSGYAYVDGGRVALLAATNRRTASRLLWAALAGIDGEVSVPHVTAANEWAIDVAMAGRLGLRTEGYLALRGMQPPAPYVHHGSLM